MWGHCGQDSPLHPVPPRAEERSLHLSRVYASNWFISLTSFLAEFSRSKRNTHPLERDFLVADSPPQLLAWKPRRDSDGDSELD